MSKELEALKEIKLTWNCMNPNSSLAKDSHFDVIGKALKVLEIIKEKGVNTLLVMNVRDYNEYCRYMAGCFNYEPLTQKEYELLKEVLL